MKQAHLIGKVDGLRPSQQRRLEALLHKRHPENSCADQVTLERLAEESLGLQLPLHMIIDSRGLCRFICVGSLEQSGQLISQLKAMRRRKAKDWRLISCIFNYAKKDFSHLKEDSIVALDLSPIFWLCFSSLEGSSGVRFASLWTTDSSADKGWALVKSDDLGAFCKDNKLISPSRKSESFDLEQDQERVLLLTLTSKDGINNDRNLAELEGLVRSAGAYPIAVAKQRQGAFNPQTIWGIGKLKEVALEVRKKDASLVIADRELSPTQARNLEHYISCPVMDRSELILDIFAQRASSATGRLQVELAQLRYRKSRLIGRGKSLSRQGGGIGTRGPGETQLEKDRRTIVRRIERLVKDLNEIKKHRSRLRKQRQNLPRVAIVGYTNVGKSSLINALCGLSLKSKVLAENKLFATLDPTTRRLIFPKKGGAPNELLITDTVGFIRELPAPLTEAFRATLEETLEADVLLLLVDLSNPDWESQMNIVNDLLNSLNVNSKRLVVANKIDCCDSSSIEAISRLNKEVIYVSATSGVGLQGLKNWLQDQFWPCDLRLQLEQGHY